jgi:hypothetical protein
MTARLPWFVWTSLVSVTCIVAGSYWDISWHMSIGRDSFWTPAHLAIQAGGIIAGVAGSILIFPTTFRADAPLRPASIGVFGFRGPFGAFLGAWGAATMVVSAPFDNWWHSAYGLDVKILSPPHVVLTIGILGVATAGLLLVLATMNRATGLARRQLGWVLLVIAGEVLVLAMTAILEHTFRSNLHRADAYRAMALVAPLILITFAQVSSQRWAATAIATFYTAFMVAMVWLFPLFPAEPKLGPVYQHITHLIPLQFPLLVIAPAIAIDLVRARTASWPRWRLAPVLGLVFVATLVAAEWPFATFLQSPAARNAVFGADYFPYFMQPGWYETRHEFMLDGDLAIGMTEAVVAAIFTSWLGLTVATAMRRVRR